MSRGASPVNGTSPVDDMSLIANTPVVGGAPREVRCRSTDTSVQSDRHTGRQTDELGSGRQSDTHTHTAGRVTE